MKDKIHKLTEDQLLRLLDYQDMIEKGQPSEGRYQLWSYIGSIFPQTIGKPCTICCERQAIIEKSGLPIKDPNLVGHHIIATSPNIRKLFDKVKTASDNSNYPPFSEYSLILEVLKENPGLPRNITKVEDYSHNKFIVIEDNVHPYEPLHSAVSIPPDLLLLLNGTSRGANQFWKAVDVIIAKSAVEGSDVINVHMKTCDDVFVEIRQEVRHGIQNNDRTTH